MAVPSYGHDLTDWISDSDTTAWSELTNAASGGAPDEADTESALQGTNSCSQSTNTTSLCSMCRILTSPVTLSSGQVFLVWHGHGVATALLGYSSGGLRVAAATDVNNWKAWAVAGNDVPPFPYSKWVNSPIDPTISYDYSYGTPPSGGTSIYGVGSMCQLSATVMKGQPHICDMIRYGRAEARFNAGESGSPATFAGFASSNDAQTARWGLIQATSGGYLWKGLMTLGYNSTAVYMVDSNKTIFVQDCRKVSSGFNKIEVRVATSFVDWTNVTFINTSPSTNASAGSFEMIDAADVDFEGCSFIDLGTFVFKSTASVLGCNFVTCGEVDSGGASFVNSKILTPSVNGAASDLAGFVWDYNADPDGYMDGMTFSKGTNSHHAIEFGTTSPTSLTLRDCTFSGFNASNSQYDSTFYVARTTGTVTINLVGCSGNMTYKSAGATVSLVIDPVTTSVTVKDLSTGLAIEDANVLVWVTDSANYPYQASVSITGSGTTATVTHTAHGMSSGDFIIIEGVTNDDDYNGVHEITKINDNSYSYTADDTLTSPASGTITATFAVISSLTSATGVASDNRSWTADQAIAGRIRKAVSSPYYIQGSTSGTIDTETGFSTTVFLVRDE